MSIDPVAAMAASVLTSESSWDPDDVILYHLGVGAGVGPGRATDAKELAYIYERDLKVLPSFAVVTILEAVADINVVDGIDIALSRVLHGEHHLELHRPLPISGRVRSTSRVSAVYDKGSAALLLLEMQSSDSDGPLFTNRFSIFARGEGGFGGETGPKAVEDVPKRQPDAVVRSSTLEHQALLYRLTGDKNPLHADPSYAAKAGFDRPILHGLCTYGAVCKAVVDELLDGDVTRVASYQVRFAGVVYPGETIVTEMWREADRIVVHATTTERGTPVLSNASVALR